MKERERKVKAIEFTCKSTTVMVMIDDISAFWGKSMPDDNSGDILDIYLLNGTIITVQFDQHCDNDLVLTDIILYLTGKEPDGEEVSQRDVFLHLSRDYGVDQYIYMVRGVYVTSLTVH